MVYRTSQPRVMTLGAHEFIRRFLQHVLPGGVHKVRYYGLWSPSNRESLADCNGTKSFDSSDYADAGSDTTACKLPGRRYAANGSCSAVRSKHSAHAEPLPTCDAAHEQVYASGIVPPLSIL